MSCPFNLTRGAISRIQNNQVSEQPILQLLDVRRIMTSSSGERYRLILSDGESFIQGMLATQISNLAVEGKLQKYSIIRLSEYVCNTINHRRICIVIRCDVIGTHDAAIGEAKSIQPTPSTTAPQVQNTRPPPPPPSTYQQPPPPPRSSMPQQRNYTTNYANNSDNFQPVESLNPYQNNWRIKVRCTAKERVRHYSNTRNPNGRVFSVDLLDKEGGEIRATCFNQVVDKFYTVFEPNNVYYISKGTVRIAKKAFTHIKNDYCIILDERSEVTKVNEDVSDIQSQKYGFIQIQGLQEVQPNAHVDIIGCVETVGELTTIRKRSTQTDLLKRTLVVADISAKVDVTLWGETAQEFDEAKCKGAIIAFKGCRVSDFGGRSLSAGSGIALWPTIPEAEPLQKWKQEVNDNFSHIPRVTNAVMDRNTERLTLEQATEKGVGKNDNPQFKGDFFLMKGTITAISHSQDRPPWYKAAPDPEMRSKVTEDGKGGWYCSKNNKSYSTYDLRYLLRFNICDATSSQWVNCFHDQAKQILNVEAKQLEEYLMNGRADQYEKVFRDACFQTKLFKVRAKPETYQDEREVRYTVLDVRDTDTLYETEYFLDLMSKLDTVQQVY